MGYSLSNRTLQGISAIMMTSSNGNNFRVTGLLWGEGNSSVTDEFPSQRPVTRSFHVFFDLHLKKSYRRRCFEMPLCSLLRRCNCFTWSQTPCITVMHFIYASVGVSGNYAYITLICRWYSLMVRAEPTAHTIISAEVTTEARCDADAGGWRFLMKTVASLCN